MCLPGFLGHAASADGCGPCDSWAVCLGGYGANQTFCPPGQRANRLQACDVCPAGKAGGGQQDRATCTGNTVPDSNSTGCECSLGHYNSSYGRVYCHERNYIDETRWLLGVLNDPDGRLPAEYADIADDVLLQLPMEEVPEQYNDRALSLREDPTLESGRCLPCPLCAQCNGGQTVTIATGWTVAPQATTNYTGLSRGLR